MELWIVVLAVTLALCLICFIFLVSRFAKFQIIKSLADGKGAIRYVISFFVVLIGGAVSYFLLGAVNTAVIFIHLTIIWIVCGIVGKKLGGKDRPPWGFYWVGIFAIGLTAAYLALGVNYNYKAVETDYKLATDKALGDLKVAMIADSHLGTTFDAKGFEKYLQAIEKKNPDLLVIAGDFVDDETDRKDMEAACQALGRFKSKYGVFFAYGNHDKGYFRYRDFTDEDLKYSLGRNRVKILEDQSILVDNRFYVVGRADKYMELADDTVARTNIKALTRDLDKDKYKIVIDHQPGDFNTEAEAGVDLVLSGHTHGGQMYGIDVVMRFTRQNDLLYGYERRASTDFIVTSGLSDWAMKFKTCHKSEYVMVDIKGK